MQMLSTISLFQQPARPKYNHPYILGFSVDSNDPEGATAQQILTGIAERLAELRRTGEVHEAVGPW